jgi:hypothetical protein
MTVTRNSLADRLAVEARALAHLKVEKAKFDGDKKVVEADLARCAICVGAYHATAEASGQSAGPLCRSKLGG